MDYYAICSKKYLSHHGILGQKWGKRNGPPYPLDEEDHSAKEFKEGYTKSKLGKRNEKMYDRDDYRKKEKEHDKNIDKQYKATKKDLDFVINKNQINQGLSYAKTKAKEIVSSDKFKIAVGVGVALVALYAAKRISQKVILDSLMDDFTPSSTELLKWSERENGFSALDSIPKASINYAEEYFKEGKLDNLLNHNNYFEGDTLVKTLTNPFKAIKLAVDDPEAFDMVTNRSQNCMLCTNNLIMRLKGYECIAQETSGGSGWTPGMINEWFENAKIETPNKYTRSGLISELANQGEGAYGNFLCYWKKGGGHSILYTVRSDGVHFIDGQIGKEYTYSELFRKLNPENCRYARLDKCNIKQDILKAVEAYSKDTNNLIRY